MRVTIAWVMVMAAACSFESSPRFEDSGRGRDLAELLAGAGGKSKPHATDVDDAGELEPLDAGELEPLDAGELERDAAAALDAGGRDSGPSSSAGAGAGGVGGAAGAGAAGPCGWWPCP